QNPEMGGFDDIKTLVNPNHSEMAVAIELWFRERQRDDLAVLFFSGHGVKDESCELYFAACDTRKIQGNLIQATAVCASFVRSCLRRSKSKRQVVILDCCFSGAFGDLLAKDDGDVDLESQLGTEGGVVLTSSSSLQYSFEKEGFDLSIYTHYLVEGIRTGAADQDSDGAVSVEELHQYASQKVQTTAPAMTPKIIVLKDEGFGIVLAQAPIGAPTLKYRKEVERHVYQGKFSIPARRLLKRLRDELGLPLDEADAIEAEVLQPYREHQHKLKEYEDTLVEALQNENPLSDRTRNDLKDYQKYLGLSDEDAVRIEQKVIPHTEAEEQEAQEREQLAKGVAGQLKQHSQSPQFDRNALAESETATDDDDLSSDKGVDYAKLRDLLAQGKWKEADKETLAVMLKVARREQQGYLRVEDIKNFPCKDLRTIDNLWVKYSKGRFGFSVQKCIWLSLGGTSGADYETYRRFGDRVGWRVNNGWLDYYQLTFSLQSPQGHLPVGAWGGAWGVGGDWSGLVCLGGFVGLRSAVGCLFSRDETCKL
ncbi:MAG TPA: GUN4 domain-containing protein, partial [Waterburya sp.]